MVWPFFLSDSWVLPPISQHLTAAWVPVRSLFCSVNSWLAFETVEITDQDMLQPQSFAYTVPSGAFFLQLCMAHTLVFLRCLLW